MQSLSAGTTIALVLTALATAPLSSAGDEPPARPDMVKDQARPDPASSPPASPPPQAKADDANKADAARKPDEAKSDKPAEPAAGTRDEIDVAAARAQVNERLKAIESTADKADTGTTKPLRELLQERLEWIKQYEAETKARDEALHPDKSPEREASQLKADLERALASLEQAKTDPNSLLPDSFRRPTDRVSAAALSEMKDEIDATKVELDTAVVDLEQARSKKGGALASLRTERDKIHHDVSALPARKAEYDAAVSGAKSADSRELAREKLANFEWEARVLNARLLAREARIALETKRAALAEPIIQLREARRELARRTLAVMQARYGILVERQQNDLKRAAAHEEVRAAQINDPLGKYRAKRTAELLVLKAQALKDEHALSASSILSVETERELADRAERDFDGLKQLVQDGRAGAILALRLKNDYRRLSFERTAVTRNELVRATDDMTRWENALTAVELDLVTESSDERYALENLLEVLPPARRPDARALAEQLDAERRNLLVRRRVALEKLADRAAEVHKQVARRLATLDDQYAFVRTHIFWMRDAEPIGPGTIGPLPGECRTVAQAAIRIACEACDRSSWGRVSAAFSAVAVLALVLPWPLHRARLTLGAQPTAGAEPQATHPS